MSTYVYTINSIGLNIVYFANKHAAYSYAERHSIRMADGNIRIHRVNPKIAQAVRDDFNEYKRLQTELK